MTRFAAGVLVGIALSFSTVAALVWSILGDVDVDGAAHLAFDDL